MKLVTITTDFGSSDGYVTSLKGAIYSAHPTCQVVDLIHNVQPYDIVVGSLFLRQAVRHFPDKTIHIAAIDLFYEEFGSILIGKVGNQYVITPNNGLLSLLGLDDKSEVYLCEYVYNGFNSFLDGLKKVLSHLTGDQEISNIGTLYPGHKQRFDLQPTVRPGQIRASVVHIDRFENAILNVDQKLFDQSRNGRKFSIFYKRSDPITKISAAYGDVEIGEAMALFNSYGLLEIGINKGKAHSMLGIGVEDAIIIEFEES